jgi:unsaturated pyranuronate lyase
MRLFWRRKNRIGVPSLARPRSRDGAHTIQRLKYFDQGGGTPTESHRVVDVEVDLPQVEMSAGLVFRPLVGQNILLSFVRFEPHTEAPLHAHEEEQALIVLEGTLEVEVGGEVVRLGAGQVAHIPAWVPHAARSLDEPVRELDVFSPPRQALLQAMKDRGL